MKPSHEMYITHTLTALDAIANNETTTQIEHDLIRDATFSLLNASETSFNARLFPTHAATEAPDDK